MSTPTCLLNRHVAALLAGLALLAPPMTQAACARPADAKAFEAAYAQAASQRHSIEQLTCAAGISAVAAASQAANVDLQMLALDAQINLLEAIQAQFETQTYQGGEAFKDLSARWHQGVKQGRAVSARLARPAQARPAVAALRIAFDLVSVSSVLVPPDVAFRSAAGAFKPLAEIVRKDPKVLDGIGELMLGRLYYQLPESVGGDVEKALPHMQAALDINPRSIAAMRWLAETQVALGQKDQAREVLARMLALEPEPAQRQEFADELRAGAGLSQRAGDAALSARIDDKRSALLRRHPELQTRQTAAVLGHGGVDPLTGKSTD